jgi:hypothetical protein
VDHIKQKQEYLSKLYKFLESISKEILGSDHQSRMELINVKKTTILKIRETQKEIYLLKKKEVINKNG